MQISSDKVSGRFLEINNCKVQHLGEHDYRMVRPAGRQDYYMLYILRGACRIFENGTVRVASAGDLVFYRPHERQEYAFLGSDRSVTAFVHFSGTAVEELLGAYGIFAERVIRVGGSKRPERLFRDMVDEFCLKKPHWQQSAAALLQQFFAAVARAVAYRETAVSPTLEHSMDEVLRVMHRRYAENHDVAYYAAMCHLSVGRFAHVFKESTGTSPKHYLLQIRIDAALDLLANTGLNVAQVAEAVGIPDVNYFSRLMKKYTGRSPREQR